VTLQEIFRFKETGFDQHRKILGQFQAMGMIPTFIEKLEQKGVRIPRELFSNEQKPPSAASNPAKASPAASINPMAALKKTGTGGGRV